MDEESFHAFYEQTARNLRGYLRSMLNNQAIDRGLVDDLLQESYFRFLKAGLPDSTEPAHRKNYLYRIATNLVRDHRRARKVEELPEDSADATSADSLDTAHDVGRAFLKLKQREREVLWMAYVECFDHREIAEVLRTKAVSIRPMLARARARFGDILRRRGIGA
jgi:RNA polymerase sigma-70 factor (ECF subfamily)